MTYYLSEASPTYAQHHIAFQRLSIHFPKIIQLFEHRASSILCATLELFLHGLV